MSLMHVNIKRILKKSSTKLTPSSTHLILIKIQPSEIPPLEILNSSKQLAGIWKAVKRTRI